MHALIFVISPDAIKSEACRNEIALAVETRKHIGTPAALDDGQRMRARRVLALLEYRSGRFAEASAHQQAIEEQKYSEEGDFLPALVDWRLGRRDDAIRRYDEAALVTASRAEPIERFVLRTEASNLIQRP